MVGYTAEEKSYKLLKGNILKRMEAERVSDAQMAAATGMSKETYRRKKLHPERFTYPELIRVFRRLGFPESEILEATKL
ncbi:MAG TPA: toxin HipA [Candidatus Blautia faecipullorum]|nr:toxin HipA [Candidatus Blautia faecipullorum]